MSRHAAQQVGVAGALVFDKELAKAVQKAREALAPPGKVWITNIHPANVPSYTPSSRLWADVEVVPTAVNGVGEVVEGLVALYGARLYTESREVTIW